MEWDAGSGWAGGPCRAEGGRGGWGWRVSVKEAARKSVD